MKNLIKPNKTITLFCQGHPSSGLRWFNLGACYCIEEEKIMKYNGVLYSLLVDNRILSLREVHKINGEEYHKPHLTFLYNDGVLLAMKGKGNKKPSSKYHKDIVELLKDPRIKVLAGDDDPKNNFQFFDLSSEDQAEVLNIIPI